MRGGQLPSKDLNPYPLFFLHLEKTIVYAILKFDNLTKSIIHFL